MTHSKNSKLPQTFFFGSILVCLGLGKAYLDGRFSFFSLIFFLLGLWSVIAVFFRLSHHQKRSKYVLPLKRLKIYLVVFGLVLFLSEANYYVSRHEHKWDLTRTKQHTLSAETVKLIKGIEQNVKVTVLLVGLPPKYLEDLLKEYEHLSNKHITTEIVDPIEQIGYAAQFGNVIRGKESKVIVQSGNERKDVDFSDEPLTEDLVNNALIAVTRHNRNVYFLKGHREFDPDSEDTEGLSTFVDILKTNNILSHVLMLGIEKKIPDNCDLLIMAGPHDHLNIREEDMINEYLEHGGDALILVENTLVTTPDKPLKREDEDKNPSLNPILNKWGLNVANDIVVDLRSHAGDDVGSPATKNYLTHRAIVSGLDYTFYVRPRSISMISSRRNSLKLAPLVLTASEKDSWGESNRTLNVKYDEGIDRAGPVPIAYVVWEGKSEYKKSDTRLAVFSDADFLTNAYIGSYSNAQMGLNLVYWLTELDYKKYLGSKVVDLNHLDLTSQQKRIAFVVLIFIPILVLILGIFVWMKVKK
jgi:ABC-type uncharacterized transport system involved in gliding motility auxiliary subunit